MALNLYIGYIKYGNKYFVNRHGIKNAVDDAITFEDVNSLLNYLNKKYSKRNSSVIIDKDIESNDRKKNIKSY